MFIYSLCIHSHQNTEQSGHNLLKQARAYFGENQCTVVESKPLLVLDPGVRGFSCRSSASRLGESQRCPGSIPTPEKLEVIELEALTSMAMVADIIPS